LNTKASGSPAFQTFIGADSTTSPSNSYTFPEFVGVIPKCQDVLTYSIVESIPSGKLTYPSASCGNPCTTLDVDVSTAVSEIDFQILVTTSIDSSSTSLSDLLYIEITATFQTPSVTASVIADAVFFVDSSDLYQIDLFTCSSGCPISNYILMNDLA
jgi:hypothetical protein